MNVTTAVLEIRARLQELSADFWKSDEVLRSLNEGIRRFSAAEKWPWLFTVGSTTLTAGDETITLPAGVSVARAFNLGLSFDDDDRVRQPRRVSPVEGFRLRGQFYTAASEPMVYFVVSEDVADSNELQTVTNVGTTVGTFTLTFDGQTTAAIARGASAATVQAALVSLSNVGAADVTCYGGPLGTDSVYVQFRGDLGGTDVPVLVLGGTTTNMSVATPNAGGGNSGEYTTVVRILPTLTRDVDVEYLYIRDAREVAVGADVLDIPEEYAMGVVAWATGNLWLKELQDSKKADEQFALYAQVLDDAKRESRKLAPDSGFAWGRSEPEPYSMGGDDYYTRMRIPQHLGP